VKKTKGLDWIEEIEKKDTKGETKLKRKNQGWLRELKGIEQEEQYLPIKILNFSKKKEALLLQ